MKKYTTYKDSGIKWIGKIPEHWGKNKILRLFNKIGSGTTPQGNGYYDGQIHWINSGDLNDGILTTTNKFVTEKAIIEISTLKIYPKGSIAVAMYGATIGKIAILDIEGCTNQACCVLCNNDNTILTEFAFRVLMTCKKFWVENSKGGTQPNINADIIKQTWIPIPPLSEQQSIVSFLEKETAQIDSYIKLRQQELDSLTELKQAEIAHAVTKGINPKAKLKPSGIKWIGEVPEHWECKRVAASFVENKCINSDLEYNEAYKFKFGTLVRKDVGVKLEEDVADTYSKYTVISKNDILVNGLNLNYDFLTQRVAIAEKKGIITSAYIAITPRENTNAQYFAYLFKSMDAKKLFNGMGTGIRLTLSFGELKKQQIPIPPLAEQQAIVNYIDKRVKQIDDYSATLQTEIAQMQEYKQRLISDAVTGKIKV